MQNRNKLIDLLIGNLSNVVVHSILEKSISHEEIADKYRKEQSNSLRIAMLYREKIHPLEKALPLSDVLFIKQKIVGRARSELLKRIARGYEHIDLSLLDTEVDAFLRRLRIMS